MNSGDTVYVASAPGNQVPFEQPRRAEVVVVACDYLRLTVDGFTLPQLYPPYAVFRTSDEAWQGIDSMWGTISILRREYEQRREYRGA